VAMRMSTAGLEGQPEVDHVALTGWYQTRVRTGHVPGTASFACRFRPAPSIGICLRHDPGAPSPIFRLLYVRAMPPTWPEARPRLRLGCSPRKAEAEVVAAGGGVVAAAPRRARERRVAVPRPSAKTAERA